MVSQLLHQCGLYLGEEDMLMDRAAYDNPEGYWEHSEITAYSDRLLEKLGGSWAQVPRPLYTGRWLDAIDWEKESAEALQILDPLMQSGKRWGWKDPRNTILLPFWKKLFPDLKLIICLRNPLEVAFSLSKRLDGHQDFQPALLLWRNYHDIIQQHYGATQHLVTHYESYFYAPEDELNRICGFAELEPNDVVLHEAVQHIVGDLYRGVATEDLLHGYKKLPARVRTHYKLFQSQAGDVYSRLIADENYQRKRHDAALGTIYRTATAAFDRFSEAHQTKQAALNQAQAELTQTRDELADLRLELNQTNEELARIRTKLAETRAELTNQTRALHLRSIQAAHIQRSLLMRLMIKIHEGWYRLTTGIGYYLGKRQPPPLFDAAWYTAQYPDAVQIRIPPYLHYLLYGWREGRNPGPEFDVTWYLSQKPDLLNEGIDPLTHYVQYGRAQGLRPHPASLPSWPEEGVEKRSRSASLMRINELISASIREIQQDGVRDFLQRLSLWLQGERRYIHTPGSRPAATYMEWLAATEPDAESLEAQRSRAGNLAYRPLFSFVTPVYNPPPDILRELLDAVLAQTYDHWELCLVNGGDDAAIEAVITAYEQRDPRIRCRHLRENRGISGNSNAALEMAQGEFIVLLDHDDLVAPNLLFEAAQLLNSNTDLDLIYYDEDKIDRMGRRFTPFFKHHVFSSEMLYCCNQLTHCVLRRSVVQEVGGFDPGTDGAQDWDLFLRVIEREDISVAHIPRVLYSWRAISTSTSGGVMNKPYALRAQKRAIVNHLRRSGLESVRYEWVKPHIRRVRWRVSARRLSVILFVQTQDADLREWSATLSQNTTYPDVEYLVLSEHELSGISNLPGVSSSRVSGLTQVQAYNYGASQAQGELLLFLNSGVRPLDADWIQELAQWMEIPDVGIAGGKLLDPQGKTIIHYGCVFSPDGEAQPAFRGLPEDSATLAGDTMWYSNLCIASADFLITRRDVFSACGGFDESLSADQAAQQFCLLAREKGWRTVLTPFARFAARRTKEYPIVTPDKTRQRARALLERKSQELNPNLVLRDGIPTLRDRSHRVSPVQK